MIKEVVAKEVAQQDFERFADCMDLDIDTDQLDEDEKQGLQQQSERIVNAIRFGSLVINENGEPVFTPQRVKDAEPITFHEPTGASLMAMDRRKKTEDVAKLYAAMGDMSRTSAGVFSKMKMSDLKVCMAIITLFLG